MKSLCKKSFEINEWRLVSSKVFEWTSWMNDSDIKYILTVTGRHLMA